MTFVLNRLQVANTLVRQSFSRKRAGPLISASFPCRTRADGVDGVDGIDGTSQHEGSAANDQSKPVDAAKDRSKVVPVETSIAYLTSDAYKEAYGDNPVWRLYRRNHKGQIPPTKTRKTCIRQGIIATGSPCPICRDEYLVLHYRNVKLLKQFISEYNGEILSYGKTNICQKRHKELLIEVCRARDHGTIKFDVPVRSYDYSEWAPSAVQT